MSKFTEYKEKGKDAFIEAENTRQLEMETEEELKIGGDFDYSGQELQEHFLERKNESDIKTRTKYYFEEEGIMNAKATRYRSLATQGDAITRYSRRYTNHSASKRKKSARKAATAFENVARLEQQYSGEQTDSVTKLKHKEEIIRARLEGMKKAAEVKSRSKKNEAYRKLKAQVSCLTILKEQADAILAEESNMNLRKQLKTEVARIDKELQKANDDITKMVPSAVSQWEKEIGIPDKISSKLKIYKRINPECDEEAAEAIMKMKDLSLEMERNGGHDLLNALEQNHMYPGYSSQGGDISRILQFNMLPVLRDKNGLPINKAEQKKAEHNKRWADALRNADVEKKNQVILESVEYFKSLRIPSPRELRDRGTLYLLRKDPCTMYAIMRMVLTWDNLRKYDTFAQQYEEEHPEFKLKRDAATEFTTLFMNELTFRYLVRQGNEDGIPGDKSLYGASNATVQNRRSFFTPDYVNILYESYEYNYKRFVEGAKDWDNSDKMNERQKEASKDFLTKHSDDYDKNMRQRINAPTENDLAKNVSFAFYSDEMLNLVDNAYTKVVNKKTLSNSEKIKRAELINDKRSLQADMRKALDDFLMERQLRIGEGLEKDFFVERGKNNWVKKEEKDIAQSGINEKAIPLGYDWACYDGDAGSGFFDIVKKGEAGNYFSTQLKKLGNHLLGVDISRFEYKSDEDFVSKLKDNYMWLKRAESLSAAYEAAKEEDLIENDRNFSMSKLDARLSVLKEIKADYDARIDMMNSPYYTILANKDVKSLSNEEMRQRLYDYETSDPQLCDYLKKYMFLNKDSYAFKKNVKASDREKTLAESIKQNAADKMSRQLLQLKEMGLEIGEEESKKNYENRMIRVFEKMAQQKVPAVDSAFVRANDVYVHNTVGNLKNDELKKLENWIEDNLANEKMLRDKGFNDEELQTIRDLRQISYEARKSTEIQAFINREFGVKWNEKTLEKPENNEKIDEDSYDTLYKAYKTFQNISHKIGVPSEQRVGADAWYENSIRQITDMFTQHNILFNTNVEERLEKQRNKEKEKFQKSLDDDDVLIFTLAGKEYKLPKGFESLWEQSGMTVEEDQKPILEKKMAEYYEIIYTGAAYRSMQADPKDGEYNYEYAKLGDMYQVQLRKLAIEIKGMLKKPEDKKRVGKH